MRRLSAVTIGLFLTFGSSLYGVEQPSRADQVRREVRRERLPDLFNRLAVGSVHSPSGFSGPCGTETDGLIIRTLSHGIPIRVTPAIRLRRVKVGIDARGSFTRGDVPAGRYVASNATGSGSLRPLAMVSVGLGYRTVGARLVVGIAGFAIGVIVWAIETIVEFGAWTLVVPPRGARRRRDGEEDLSAPDLATIPKPIEVRTDDGVRLAGRWYPAPGERPAGRTVLLLHGFAEDSSVWEAGRASILNRHGWNVAALDSRGYGQSGGLHASFGGREAGDVQAWLDAIARRLAGHDREAPFCAALWGRSMGAAIAMRAAVVDCRIAALVLESPMVDLDAAVATLLHRRGLRLTGLLARLITRRAGRIAGVPLGRPRPVDMARRVSCRNLIVHGSDDWLVPNDQVRRLADAFPVSPGRIEVPGAGHSNVVGTGGEELVRRIAEFLDVAHRQTNGFERAEQSAVDEHSQDAMIEVIDPPAP